MGRERNSAGRVLAQHEALSHIPSTLHSKFKATSGYMRPCFKTKQKFPPSCSHLPPKEEKAVETQAVVAVFDSLNSGLPDFERLLSSWPVNSDSAMCLHRLLKKILRVLKGLQSIGQHLCFWKDH